MAEYVCDQAHTNGVESFGALMKRDYQAIYHHWSVKHVDRHVTQFNGRHNSRPVDTDEQMWIMVPGADGKWLTYETLVGLKEIRQLGML